MPGREDWWNAAATESDDDLRERILTGFKSGKPFTPYAPTIGWPPVESVLDFGCGVGRSFPYLRSVARRISGFDLPPMIARCRALGTEQVSRLSSDWVDVRTRRYDLVFASLVLQHIDTAECRRYLTDFAGIAPCVYLLTRTRTDFDAVMLDLVAESGLYHASACRIVDHDPATHQLRVIADRTFDAARESPDDVHYEVLLRSRIP